MNLNNNRLSVEIAEPGSIYNRTRFDWTGFITQVTLDGRHTFCSRESNRVGKGTGGIGMCNEFGIFGPIGFDDARPGESFVKPGVGLLVRPDEEEYEFVRAYDFTPFEITTSCNSDEANFVVQPLPCRGYALRLQKTVRLQKNELHIEYALENVGERRLQVQEYNHNFLAINNAPIGPDYEITTPVTLSGARIPAVLKVDKLQVSLRKTPGRSFYCRATKALPGRADTEQNTMQPIWSLIHRPSGLVVQEHGDYQLDMFALWGDSHVVSPEAFVNIDVLPGETQRWTRCYKFFQS
ncbi:MAG TPA: hypothetical protein VF719_05480 [Abditibacteriaceae bacterium]|jgi:hypothetical protein